MRRTLLFLFLLLAGNTTFAQDYALLPDTGIRRYFTNSAGYLRGIRVDSVVQENGYKRYVTFKTARGWNNNSGNFTDSSGACWLGKNVRAYANGDWQFPNQYGDTLIIKTAAQTGDAWVFYSDTSAVWFQAQVIAQDTQTVRGNLDSVKRITLTAKSGSTTLTSHPLNGWQLILSKKNGFAQLPDCYLFPYRDYEIYNNVTNPWYLVLQPTSQSAIKSNLIFRAVPNLFPVGTRIYDFQPGMLCNTILYITTWGKIMELTIPF